MPKPKNVETPAQEAHRVAKNAKSDKTKLDAVKTLKRLRRENPDDYAIVKEIAHLRARQRPEDRMVTPS